MRLLSGGSTPPLPPIFIQRSGAFRRAPQSLSVGAPLMIVGLGVAMPAEEAPSQPETSPASPVLVQAPRQPAAMLVRPERAAAPIVAQPAKQDRN
jgi:hypothetical protein